MNSIPNIYTATLAALEAKRKKTLEFIADTEKKHAALSVKQSDEGADIETISEQLLELTRQLSVLRRALRNIIVDLEPAASAVGRELNTHNRELESLHTANLTAILSAASKQLTPFFDSENLGRVLFSTRLVLDEQKFQTLHTVLDCSLGWTRSASGEIVLSSVNVDYLLALHASKAASLEAVRQHAAELRRTLR